MKYLAWLIAACVIVAGMAFIVAPDRMLGLRALEATQGALLVVAVIRITIGVVLIWAAPASRFPRALQVAGALMLGAGLVTPLFGVDRTKAVLAWGAAQGPVLMQALGVLVLALGGCLAFALTPRAKAAGASVG